MKKTGMLLRKVMVPVLTLMFLLGSATPAINFDVKDALNGQVAMVEMYDNQALAATNWNTIAKNYGVKVYKNDLNRLMNFESGMGKPFIASGRTFLPYRAVAEYLQAKVTWNATERKVTAVSYNEDNKVEMWIGKTSYKVNGETKTMDVEPFILAVEARGRFSCFQLSSEVYLK